MNECFRAPIVKSNRRESVAIGGQRLLFGLKNSSTAAAQPLPPLRSSARSADRCLSGGYLYFYDELKKDLLLRPGLTERTALTPPATQ